MVIRAYHESRGDSKRVKVIVPDSAHGTNPASAAVVDLKVVEVKSLPDGTVDIEALRPLLDDTVAAMMMTNPNTVSMFEHGVKEIAEMVHEAGALMYYDGANLNPMLGIARPGDMGFDVMHINLHKTFSTPHGGGDPAAAVWACAKGWNVSCLNLGFVVGMMAHSQSRTIAASRSEVYRPRWAISVCSSARWRISCRLAPTG